MFDIGSTELLLIVIVAILVIGPKDLPRVLYKVGQVVGKARGMARHFRTGIDAMVREVELQELEKKWAEQNRRIMQDHPPETLPGMAADDGASSAAEGVPAQQGTDAPDPAAQTDLADTPMMPLAQETAHGTPAPRPAPKSDEAA